MYTYYLSRSELESGYHSVKCGCWDCWLYPVFRDVLPSSRKLRVVVTTSSVVLKIGPSSRKQNATVDL